MKINKQNLSQVPAFIQDERMQNREPKLDLSKLSSNQVLLLLHLLIQTAKEYMQSFASAMDDGLWPEYRNPVEFILNCLFTEGITKVDGATRQRWAKTLTDFTTLKAGTTVIGPIYSTIKILSDPKLREGKLIVDTRSHCGRNAVLQLRTDTISIGSDGILYLEEFFEVKEVMTAEATGLLNYWLMKLYRQRLGED